MKPRSAYRLWHGLRTVGLVIGTVIFFWWLTKLQGDRNDSLLQRLDSQASIAGALGTACSLLLAGIFHLLDKKAVRLTALDLAPAERYLRGELLRDYDLRGSMKDLFDLSHLDIGWLPIPPKAGVTGKSSQTLDVSPGRNVAALASAFSKLTDARMVIVGPPGSGKTVTALLLAHKLLSKDQTDVRWLPVVVGLADWAPAGKEASLREWIASELMSRHPRLLDYGREMVLSLVNQQRVLAILDGLDELDLEMQKLVLEELAHSGPGSLPFILTSQVDSYRLAVKEGLGRPLSRAAVVELQPINAKQIMEYLTASSFTGEQKRWDTVRGRVRNGQGPLFRVLQYPLMTYLTSVAFRDDPNNVPQELASLRGEAKIRRYLHDKYIPALYSGHDPEKVKKRLGILARCVDESSRSVDLAWWRLHLLVPRALIAMPVILAANLSFSLQYGLAGNLVGFVVIPLVISIVNMADRPRQLHFTSLRIFLAVLIGCAVGAAFGWIALPQYRWITAITVGGTAVCVVALLTSARPAPGPQLNRPRTMLAHHRAAFMAVVLIVVLCTGFRSTVQYGWPRAAIDAIQQGVVLVLLVCASTKIGASWLLFNIARLWLFLRWRFPLRLMTFLEDAYDKGVLRRSGPVWQFRHPDIQHYLASSSPMGSEIRAAPGSEQGTA